MKKILSFLMVLSMLLAMIVIPVGAEGASEQSNDPTGASMTKYMSSRDVYDFSAELEKEVEDRVKTVTLEDDNVYTVIWTAEQLIKMPANTTGYYILGDDLDFSEYVGDKKLVSNACGYKTYNQVNKTKYGATLPDSYECYGVFGTEDGKIYEYTFDGNGCAINNIYVQPTVAFSGLFPNTHFMENTVKNLTINAEVNFTVGMTAVLFGRQLNSQNKLNIDNVQINASGIVSNTACGIFVGYTSSGYGINITNCTLNADDLEFAAVGSNQESRSGGFVGRVDAGTTSFYNCKAIGKYTFNGNRAGGFVGNTFGSSATIKFEKCMTDGEYSINNFYCGGFVGRSEVNNNGVNNAKFEFVDCKAKGNYLFAVKNGGIFVGQTDTSKSIEFENCAIDDVNIVSMDGIVGGYIGYHHNTSSNVTFTGCSASGLMYASGSNATGGYIGSVYHAATFTFDDCKNNLKIVSTNDKTGGFIGGAEAARAYTFNFKNSRFGGAIFSSTTASGFVHNHNMTNATIKFDDCEFTGTALSTASYIEPFTGAAATVEDLDVDGTSESTVSGTSTDLSEKMGSGEGTYTIYDAQVKAGIPEKITFGVTDYALRFGQDLATETVAKLGGAIVYKHTTVKGEVVYSNKAAFEKFEAPEDGSAVIYYQLKANNDPSGFRALIDVSEEYLDEVTSMKLTVTFKTGEDTTKVLTVENAAIEMFYAVYADGELYEVAEGRVLIVAAVDGITDSWTGDFRVELVTDGSADAVDAYNAEVVGDAIEN